MSQGSPMSGDLILGAGGFPTATNSSLFCVEWKKNTIYLMGIYFNTQFNQLYYAFLLTYLVSHRYRVKVRLMVFAGIHV
jgi:hypothetical protein